MEVGVEFRLFEVLIIFFCCFFGYYCDGVKECLGYRVFRRLRIV